MIKAIIFDVGGVLVRTEDHSYRRRWEEALGLRPGEAEEIVFDSAMGRRAQLGEISDRELWEWIRDRLHLGRKLEAFRADFWAGDVLDQGMVSAVRLLRPQYQTAVISNATDALRETLANKHGIADAFDLIVGSAEENVMKPSPAIFERTLAALGRRPPESLFIDDFEQNVAGAKAVGMAAVHYRPGMDLGQELGKFGISLEQV